MSVDILGTSWDQWVLLYVHGNHEDGQPRTATSTLIQLLNYDVILHEWLAFCSAFLNIRRSGVLTALASAGWYTHGCFVSLRPLTRREEQVAGISPSQILVLNNLTGKKLEYFLVKEEEEEEEGSAGWYTHGCFVSLRPLTRREEAAWWSPS